MPDGLEARVSALEQDFRHLYELVDGQEEWSHRKRLHALENDNRAAELAARALQAFEEARRERDLARRSRWANWREWGTGVLAAAAILRPWEWWS